MPPKGSVYNDTVNLNVREKGGDTGEKLTTQNMPYFAKGSTSLVHHGSHPTMISHLL